MKSFLTWSLFIFAVFWAGLILGQKNISPLEDSESDSMAKRMQMRDEMHRRLIDKLFKGQGPDQGMFSDMESIMDEFMADSFTSRSSHFKMQWLDVEGARVLEITPQSPGQQLDIDVSGGMVTVKGQSQQKSSGSSFVSNFSQSFNVPQDCDASKVKIESKNGKLLVIFPLLTGKTPPINKISPPKKIPLPPSDEDVDI
jgi:HSP20 family molecular chaperone IbpA